MKYTDDDTLTKEQNELIRAAHTLKMPHLAEALMQQFKDPNSALRDRTALDLEAFSSEIDYRNTKHFIKLLRKASLKYADADLDDSVKEGDRKIDLKTLYGLSTCGFVREHKNVLITGKAGTGKTYISNALAVSALRNDIRVLYVRVNALLNDFDRYRGTQKYFELNDQLCSVDLLVSDDFGLMPLEPHLCREFFEVTESRNNERSTIITSQLPVKSWWGLFKDSTYADACISRMIQGAYRLELDGPDRRQMAEADA